MDGSTTDVTTTRDVGGARPPGRLEDEVRARKILSVIFGASLLVSVLHGGNGAIADGGAESIVKAARYAEPVVLTGAELPGWSRLPATGAGAPYPSGSSVDRIRSAHNGFVVVPPDARPAVAPERIVAFRWSGSSWEEVPVQVDERFPYFLANARSSFSTYSGTDYELAYEWDVENWKKVAGDCSAGYPQSIEEVDSLIAAGVITVAPSETKAAYLGAVQDPVAELDDDDEVVVMASDAGGKAPLGAEAPAGADSQRQEIALTDPLNPAGTSFIYLFTRDAGSSFNATNGYVGYQRDLNADEYIDRYSLRRDDPETLAVSNTGYGPNLPGTVCRTAEYSGYPAVPDGTPRQSTDRFPRDGVTVSTDSYQWRATGRWMVRNMHVSKPNQAGVYGPDLIDRWKGRAFQQSPDSTISLVGFEDEQVNWEANSALLGERFGPVRAIRETWGADSGTNVTKRETFYRDAVTYTYYLRVHPIPPDGIYTSWDYNAHTAVKYFNVLKPEGVDIDGVNDDIGNIDSVPNRPEPVFFDVSDPTFDVPSAIERWEQVSGKDDTGSLVYIFETKSATSLENPAIVPFYRDDKCLDDGTGDNPVPRPWPGEATDDPRVVSGYSAYWGKPYDQITCDEKQGDWGSHGLHFFFTGDTDNAFTPVPITEAVGMQWQFAVPTAAPVARGEEFAQIVRLPLRRAVVTQ